MNAVVRRKINWLMKLHRYVGPKGIADRARSQPPGYPIRSPADLRAWVQNRAQEVSAGRVIATFVVSGSGLLRVADRRSEHVACAGGEPIRSAGEMTFAIGPSVEIIEVSNQSTGYCPEPESWPAVAAALESADSRPLPVFPWSVCSVAANAETST